MKKVFIGIVAFIGIIALVFLLELIGLGFFKFFEPKKENIRREVFENTKSYLHGIQQDLGKYYREYQKGDAEEKAAIRGVVNMRFAEVDAAKLQSIQLANFLREMRGY